MTTPRTEAGKRLLADLTMDYEDAPGDVVMPAVKAGMAADIASCERAGEARWYVVLEVEWRDDPEQSELGLS